MPKPRVYYSFLLRMWQTSDGERCTWCASLEQPGTRERWGFGTLEQLFEFLQEKTAPQVENSGAGTPEEAGVSKRGDPSPTP
jgi:hypothetical protein